MHITRQQSIKLAFQIALIAMLALTNTISAAQIALSLRSDVSVSETVITLKDVVENTKQLDSITERYGDIVLGVSPRPGYFTFLTQQDIDSKIKSIAGQKHISLKWTGALKVKVQANGYTYNGTEISKNTEVYLQQFLKNNYLDYSYHLIRKVNDFVVPRGEIRLVVKPTDKDTLSKRTCLWVDIFVNEKHFQTVPVWYEISVWKEVLVIRHDLKKGTLLKEEDVVKLRRDITYSRQRPIEEINDIQGMRMRNAVNGNTILTIDHVEEIPPVVKGDKVLVLAKYGSVQISSTGIAQKDGEFLERIMIRGGVGTGNYKATVIGNGKVRVD